MPRDHEQTEDAIACYISESPAQFLLPSNLISYGHMGNSAQQKELTQWRNQKRPGHSNL